MTGKINFANGNSNNFAILLNEKDKMLAVKTRPSNFKFSEMSHDKKD